MIAISSNNKRTHILKTNILYSGIIKGINILVTLLLIPLTINYINAELYGIWLSLSSIAAWFGFFDIGLGLGLRNRLTTAIALKKFKYGKVLVSSTYGFLLAIFSIVALLASWGCTYVDWAYLLKVSPEYDDIITLSFQIVTIAFCLRMVLQIVSNVSQAFQKTALANSIDMIGNIISLVLVYVLTKTLLPDLIYLSIVLCVSPIIALIGANIYLFKGLFSGVSPSAKYIRMFVVRDIASLGTKFFLIQFVSIIVFQATNFLISHYCGPKQVTVYNISYKYLTVALMAFTIIQSPIWSAYNDAYAKKDYEWMRIIYKKLIKVLVLAELVILFLVIISPIVYKIWIGDSVTIPFYITCFVGIYVGLTLIGSMHAMIVNSMGKIKLEMTLAMIQGLVYIPIVYCMASLWSMNGILVSLIIASFFSFPIVLIQVPQLLNQTASGIYDK